MWECVTVGPAKVPNASRQATTAGNPFGSLHDLHGLPLPSIVATGSTGLGLLVFPQVCPWVFVGHLWPMKHVPWKGRPWSLLGAKERPRFLVPSVPPKVQLVWTHKGGLLLQTTGKLQLLYISPFWNCLCKSEGDVSRLSPFLRFRYTYSR